jgi:hypothetical protein
MASQALCAIVAGTGFGRSARHNSRLQCTPR